MDTGACQAIVHGVPELDTTEQLSLTLLLVMRSMTKYAVLLSWAHFKQRKNPQYVLSQRLSCSDNVLYLLKYLP